MKLEVYYRGHKSPPLDPVLARWIQYMFLHSISSKSILISPSHRCLSFSSGFFPPTFPTRIFCVFLCSRLWQCPTNVILRRLTWMKTKFKQHPVPLPGCLTMKCYYLQTWLLLQLPPPIPIRHPELHTLHCRFLFSFWSPAVPFLPAAL